LCAAGQGFNPRTKKHSVEYDDGDQEDISLAKEKWKLEGQQGKGPTAPAAAAAAGGSGPRAGAGGPARAGAGAGPGHGPRGAAAAASGGAPQPQHLVGQSIRVWEQGAWHTGDVAVSIRCWQRSARTESNRHSEPVWPAFWQGSFIMLNFSVMSPAGPVSPA